MADYREISQQYAQGAIKVSILLNGGAAVALLSQVGELLAQGKAGAISGPMTLWAAGTFFGAVTWIIAFASTRYVDKSEREPHQRETNLVLSDRFMLAGIATIFLSLGIFLSGALWLACNFS